MILRARTGTRRSGMATTHVSIKKHFARLKDPRPNRRKRHLLIDIVVIAGKTRRRSGAAASGLGPLHLVSAWATQNHLTLGQMAVDGKSNEITAIPKLLELLDLNGALVTIDAMGCQKEIARGVVEAG